MLLKQCKNMVKSGIQLKYTSVNPRQKLTGYLKEDTDQAVSSYPSLPLQVEGFNLL